MKIVGETWVTTDKVVQEKKTKNTVKQTIKRNIQRHLVLECGHTVDFVRFAGAVPTTYTQCHVCEVWPRIDAHMAAPNP